MQAALSSTLQQTVDKVDRHTRDDKVPNLLALLVQKYKY
jgi:hypothetical protein